MTATEHSIELVRAAARAASDKLAQDLIALDVSDRLAITDIFFIASASTERQVNAIVDGIEEVARATGEDRSSMLIDLENGMRTEIEAITGQVVRYARRHNVSVPTNDLLLRLVRAHERGHKPVHGSKEGSSYAGELERAVSG